MICSFIVRLFSIPEYQPPPRWCVTSAIDALIKTDYQASASMLNNVRIGRSHQLGHLVALVRIGLPKYQIPAELLPAPTPAPLLA